MPGAELVLTEDLQRFIAGDDGVAGYVDFLRKRMYLSAELLAGRVDRAHAPDLVALNHYTHSERYVFTAPDGGVGDVPSVYVAGEEPPRAGVLLSDAAARLGLLLALGEVHVHAPVAERVRWLAQHIDDVRALRDVGVDVRAVGVWAAFGMTDWHSLLQTDDDVLEDGVFTFARPGAAPKRTALADAVETLANDGSIADDRTRGWWERDDRYLSLDEMLAMRAQGLPEGDHLVRARSAVL